MQNEPAKRGSSTWVLALGAVIIVLAIIAIIVFGSAPPPDTNNLTPGAPASPEIGGTQVPVDVGPATEAGDGDDTAAEADEVEATLGSDTMATEESGVISPADGSSVGDGSAPEPGGDSGSDTSANAG